MERALPECLAEPLQRDRLIQVLLDEAANFLGKFRLRISARCPWAAAQACAEAGVFGVLGPGKERHILAPRPPRRARRPAIHARRGDGEDEFAIVPGIPRQHRGPESSITRAGSVPGPARTVLRHRHFARVLLRQYGRRGCNWESHVCCRHSDASLGRQGTNGLSEPCAQTNFRGRAPGLGARGYEWGFRRGSLTAIMI